LGGNGACRFFLGFFVEIASSSSSSNGFVLMLVSDDLFRKCYLVSWKTCVEFDALASDFPMFYSDFSTLEW
jgi:hypothetical protein